MAGLYIHIPFCKSRCIYCGFYSTTLLDWRQRYIHAVCKEMEIRGESLEEGGERLETVYLGGGTPSQLTFEQLQQLFIYINKVYGLHQATEITMECNPDDLTPEYVEALSQLPISRVSMGAQTFDAERLRFLHRRHSAEQVSQAVTLLRKAGIKNISIDLMYGFPDETIDSWHHDIDCALALEPEHLSAYALMYEEGTPLYQQLASNAVNEIDEELSLQMFSDLIDRLSAAGYEHYEISNFAKWKSGSDGQHKDSYRSRHNSNYWNQTPYIGLGAAAHSYDGRHCRRWNIDDIKAYVNGIENGQLVFEQETINSDTRYNDLILTALRTCEGLDLSLLTDVQVQYCLREAQRFIDDGRLLREGNRLRLTRKGIFVSNMIMSELMKI